MLGMLYPRLGLEACGASIKDARDAVGPASMDSGVSSSREGEALATDVIPTSRERTWDSERRKSRPRYHLRRVRSDHIGDVLSRPPVSG